MFKNIVKSICWFVLYLALQIVSLVGLMIFDMATGRFTMPDTQNVDKMVEELTIYLNGLTVPSLIFAGVVFFVIFILYKIIRKHEFDFKSINVPTLLGVFGLGLILNVVLTLLVNLITPMLSSSFGDALNTSTDMVLTGQPFWLILLGTGIVTPILEELTFRYGICGTMGRKNVTVALIVSSIVFGLVHGNPIQIVYATILGLMFGWSYLKGKNIWYAAAMHIAVNSSTIMVAFTGLVWLHAIWAILGIILILVALKLNPELKHFFAKNNEY